MTKIIQFFTATIISLVLLMLPLFVSWYSKTPSVAKQSAFECGFEPLSAMRKPYSMRFIMLVLLFLIFDIETVLLFPNVSYSIISYNIFYNWHLYMFLIILMIGLIHEWFQGSLDWLSN
uniref:NADH dehydrogenase subunit 3 n=1 Tax=Rabdotus mooreanus TaxID=3014811 RepID=UPI00286AAB5D|nr:NADH dehydrogenase subunit 3 [Rabdotus mooreanus]WLN31340.1 NADH dehydrogenase subunit 3 [Rabdotus mooreanus]